MRTGLTRGVVGVVMGSMGVRGVPRGFHWGTRGVIQGSPATLRAFWGTQYLPRYLWGFEGNEEALNKYSEGNKRVLGATQVVLMGCVVVWCTLGYIRGTFRQ